MIQATIKNDALEITGKMKVGDKIHGLCCDGYDWECSAIIMSAWGNCTNPECTEGIMDDGDSTYRSVSNWDDEDIALFLLGEG